jgi:poly-gamma-glutamate synthesis protein (capsule biosynthesis protein)
LRIAGILNPANENVLFIKQSALLNRKIFNPVRTISVKGKFLVGAIRTGFRLWRFFGGKDWDDPMRDHHEDPLYMRTVNILHLAHKYYSRVITHSRQSSELARYFCKNAEELYVPPDFEEMQNISLSAGGDLMPYKCMDTNTCSSLWDECGDFFFNADMVTANLETPVDLNSKPSAVPEVMLKNMYFNSSAEMFNVFSGLSKYKGYDVLSVANNHSLDQGESGLLETINFLEKRNIFYCGAAKSEDLLDDFPIIDKKGIRVAFLAATFSLNAVTTPTGKEWIVNHIPLNTADPDISLLVRQAKLARQRGADLIVAHLHMGLAYQPYPAWFTVNTMHRICTETGIDIILGGHPHNAQPFEFLKYRDPFTNIPKQSILVYSMGDFVAYDIFKWCHLPLMLRFKISKGNLGTFVTGMQAKLAYMQAEVKDGKVVSLKLRDYKQLIKNTSDLDHDSAIEFQELSEFAGQFLVTNQVKRFLV